MNNKQITLAITGASGAPYALCLLEQLVKKQFTIHLLISSAAKVVLATEANQQWPSQNDKAQQFLENKFGAQPGQILVPGKSDWFSPVASGSAAPKTMVICPCSMGTLASVAMGLSDNLLERAADVVIKEKGKLILVPREMPFSAIHLENMLKLAKLGVDILPACPGFYHKPESIQDLLEHVTARILDHIGIENDLVERWGYSGENKTGA
ncbi:MULTISPECIES: flavin prenyltransferase UbiX [unclassified Agarivorans]|uniref:flavin prenyltransferase UbiX n=1 Tax=unclassified Agarivorans TaxID=2636026 RepID=UPI0026E262FE|nr:MULTISPECIES: flavin prenyltransferase UbiX [unclassified Agarivorans]MDO6687804.1 flavin prenyltransferase UbiX [Agarivorans sp. 3_MG-2023]MDO6717332.1 flavin prenyltransferase UbiX [Agarivorans sp. 2_MG-2023]